jgi:glycosyltransferase involved in cell wall biosynthesis
MKIVFILPVSGGGGGAHSVIQEVNEMVRMGQDVRVAINKSNYVSMLVTYSDMPLVLGRFFQYESEEELAKLIEDSSIVVATIFTSVKLLKNVMKLKSNIVPAYYVQDYEPLFSSHGTPLWHEAYDSYALIPGIQLFAKTKWLQNIVYKNHGLNVHKVAPSIDHDVYYPSLNYSRKRICAMVRPKSARRAPYRTMRVLRAIQKRNPDISIDIFGCTDLDIENSNLAQDFDFTNHGVLKRGQVSALMRENGMFLDLSDFQAFGRTGLEAMACGCIPILPSVGGVYEYSEHGVDSYVMDMDDEGEIVKKVEGFFALSGFDKERMINFAIDKSQNFSIRKAALSELRIFNDI